ncbi:uncharacterized protein LOC144627807 isoform X2 [Crassostrea virginica]
MPIKLVSAILAAVTISGTYGRGRTGLCNTKDGGVICCTNYYWNGTDCVECPDGYTGTNCSSVCPSKYYGSGCRKNCTCPDSLCHHVYGCTLTKSCPDGYTGENCSTLCPPKQYGSRCGKTCNCPKSSCHHVYGCNFKKDCLVGFVGDNCTTSCSYPSYGALCNETCDCLKSSCHHIYGCHNISLTTTANEAKSEEKDREKKSGTKSDSKYRIIIIISGTLVSISLLFLIGRKIYRFLGITQIHGDHPSQSDAPYVDNVYAEINQSSRNRSRN